jgi:phosphoglucomutase
MSKQPSDRLAKVGSLYPLRKNFRLTVEVKEKFTEKLPRDAVEFHGTKVAMAR